MTNLSMTRKIIHCDCDCFFAAIEIRDDPALQGLPVAVGGDPGKRGVIATCNYEARKYGIHSAMASVTARRQCPDLIIIPPSKNKYSEASKQMHNIFKDYTALIEPLSLDEAFLDVSESKMCKGSATLIAAEIRQRVRQEMKITLSAGIAPNKFLAKVASDWNKPDGQYVITPDKINDFIVDLSVRKIFGVGKVTAAKMQNFGIETCKDLQAYSQTKLLELFGSFGERLYSLCRGIDERPVVTEHPRKSISIELTYNTDLPGLKQCIAELPDLLDRLEQRIHRSDRQVSIAKLFVKLKFNDFISTTVEQVGQELDIQLFEQLCQTGFERGNKPVRLLGLGIRLRQALNFYQLPLNFDDHTIS
ncbi:MAG: DNA polymerase IV [SAR86 cluster bacterium]|uniref:DNA polymerase IV n=1 Tax=SAR86 cluster bacterium TaxID=2030880 RepID=A0A2A5C7N5_9GAMM|nr:MAG: DNA polymerase IV [SAR86 cluster bacterium]